MSDKNSGEIDDSEVLPGSLLEARRYFRFLGLPGTPLSWKLQSRDAFKQREQPLLSPEHLSLRAPTRN